MRHRHPADEAKREPRMRSPVRHVAARGERFDHRGNRRFLKDDDIGRAGADPGFEGGLAAGPTPADVVAEKADHSMSFFSTSVRYGCPSSSPRRYITKSRVP